MRNYPSIGVQIPRILLPRRDVNLSQWAVVACDQFTSQPEYWQQVSGLVCAAPSTFHITLPEIYLGSAEEPARIQSIQQSMAAYRDQNLFEAYEGLLLVERSVAGRTRRGLMLALDLEQYDYNQGSQTPIRATEGTILERLPPRIKIRQGANLGQNTDSARLGNYVPAIAVMNGPYFAETLEEVAKLRKAPSVVKWQDELATKHGLKVVCFNWVQGYRHFFTNKPVKKPEDLRGQRIRTPPAPIWQESVRALGAAPVAMAFGEMYPALQQKAIDGVELVYNNIPGGRFYEVLKYASETKHIMLINFEVISSKFFKGLPADYQKILVEDFLFAVGHFQETFVGVFQFVDR